MKHLHLSVNRVAATWAAVQAAAARRVSRQRWINTRAVAPPRRFWRDDQSTQRRGAL